MVVRQLGRPVGAVVDGGISKSLATLAFVGVLRSLVRDDPGRNALPRALAGVRVPGGRDQAGAGTAGATPPEVEEAHGSGENGNHGGVEELKPQRSWVGALARGPARADQRLLMAATAVTYLRGRTTPTVHEQSNVGEAFGAGRARESVDAFPHTRRPLPWVLAGFVALLFLVPVDSTELKVHLPVGSQIDRFAVVALVAAWFWFGGDQRAFLRTRRSKLYVGAASAFSALAVASLLLDAPRIVNLGELTLAEKRFALLGAFLVLSWFTLTALRFEDLRGFTSYLIGIAAVTSLGVLYERHTGNNLFYEWSAILFKPIATVAPSPTVIHPEFGLEGRVTVVGPTLHGLALTSMLMAVMPFALVRCFDATSRRSRSLNALAVVLMLGAAAATDRKTALLVPVAIVLYIASIAGGRRCAWRR